MAFCVCCNERIVTLANLIWPCGPMDKASDYESGDSRFDSWQGRLALDPFHDPFAVLLTRTPLQLETDTIPNFETRLSLSNAQHMHTIFIPYVCLSIAKMRFTKPSLSCHTE